MACYLNRYDIALFLIRAERQWVSRSKAAREEQDEVDGQTRMIRGVVQNDTPSYNMRDGGGRSPVFRARSLKIVEEMLKLEDLQLTRGSDGMPLLWHCAGRGYVSEKVAFDPRLAGQYGQRWRGSLPLEQGEN